MRPGHLYHPTRDLRRSFRRAESQGQRLLIALGLVLVIGAALSLTLMDQNAVLIADEDSLRDILAIQPAAGPDAGE